MFRDRISWSNYAIAIEMMRARTDTQTRVDDEKNRNKWEEKNKKKYK